MILTTEELLTSPVAFGLTAATPVQRAMCRTLDGIALGELASHPDVIAALGGPEAVAALPIGQPKEWTCFGPIRSGKSLLAAVAALRATQNCDVSHLGPGEIPRVSILSLSTDLAAVVFGHLVGALTSSPALRRLLIEDPKADSVLIRHPSGRPIEVKVSAGAKAGGSLVSRWSAGAIFDEHTRMCGADDGAVINFEDARRAVLGRLLDGCQIVSIGSPWATCGPAYDLYKERFGRPDSEHVVWHATGPMMNPSWWTPARCAALQRSDPRAYATDVLAQFRAARGAAFDSETIDAAMLPREQLPSGECFMVLDPSSGRGDTFSWAVVTRCAQSPFDAYQLRGDGSVARYGSGAPILRDDHVPRRAFLRVVEIGGLEGRFFESTKAQEIVDQIALKCQSYGIRHVFSDQREAFSLESMFTAKGLKFTSLDWGNANKTAAVGALRRMLVDGDIQLPNHAKLRQELAAFAQVYTPTGLITFKGVGHDDYAMAIVLIGLLDVLGLIPKADANLCKWCHLPVEFHPVQRVGQFGFPQRVCSAAPETHVDRAVKARVHMQ